MVDLNCSVGQGASHNKAHSFTGASAAREVFLLGPVQEHLEQKTLDDIRIKKLWKGLGI